MEIYGMMSCNTVRKAHKWLESAGHSPTVFDFRKEPFDQATYKKLVDLAGWENVFNTKSAKWREFSEEEKAGLDEDRAISLMIEHPTLMKRPIIVADNGQVFLGFNAKVEAQMTEAGLA